MPITKSAKKALRVARRRQKINLESKKKLKSIIRLYKKNPTVKNLQKSMSLLDKSAKKGLITKQKANRLKSRLSKHIKSTKATTKSKVA